MHQSGCICKSCIGGKNPAKPTKKGGKKPC